jgi:NitT/TauT family transport system permease protein
MIYSRMQEMQPAVLEDLIEKTIIAVSGLLNSLWKIAIVLVVGNLVGLYLSYISIHNPKYVWLPLIVSELLASFPAAIWWSILLDLVNRGILQPIAVSFIVIFQGAAWYVFFSITLFGARNIDRSLIELSKIYNVRGVVFTRRILTPAIMPSALAGSLAAWGGAWNSIIIAEYIEIGETVYSLWGIGFLISSSTYRGDVGSLVFYVVFLSLFIVVFNRTFWAYMFDRLERRYR